jgi:patatin-like phospholipase/acyl hydrolase
MGNKRYKVVLTIDGGGIKGIVPLVILDHIIENFQAIGKKVIIPDLVDLFAGSSTGSVICAALMQKKRTRVLDYDHDTSLPNPAVSKSMLLDKNNLEKLKS